MYSKAFLTVLTVLSLGSATMAQTTSLSKKKIRNPSAASNSVETSGVTKTTYAKPERAESLNAALTEFAYQPKEGHVAFTATPRISNQSITILRRGDKRDSTDDVRSNLIALRVQRGLRDNFSWYAETAFGNQEADRAGQTGSQGKGITDITFGIRQLRQIPVGQFFYGVQAALSPAEREISYAYRGGRSGDGNLYSGRHTLSPYLGVQMDRRDFLVGGAARLDYHFDRVQTGRTANNIKETFETRGEHVASLEAFIERPTPRVVFGAKAGLGIATSSDTDYESGTFRRDFSTGSYQIFGAGIYAKFSPNPAKNIDILPSLSLAKTMGSSGGSLSQEEDQSINFALSVRAAL